MNQSDAIKVMSKAAEAGGKIVRSYFGKSIETTTKTIAADLQTKADVESEKIIINIIKSSYPKSNFMAEEGGLIDNGSELTFIIDPLDGTHNFSLGLPNFTVSIGLAKQGKLIAGVIYHPMTTELFTAQLSKGAFVNGKPMKCNHQADTKNLTVAHSLGYIDDQKLLAKTQLHFANIKAKRYMNLWCPSYDLCMLAMGKIEMVIVDGVEIHDIAAGKLIASEAGAVITKLDGMPENDGMSATFIASANKEILKSVRLDKLFS